MPKIDTYDVVIAGGGISGVSVAAALGEFDYRTLLVEPGQDDPRRLAGELIHPPGAADLAELGLLESIRNERPAPVHGFTIFAESGVKFVLPYAEIPGLPCEGLGVERPALRRALLAAARKLPHVEVLHGARVTALDLDSKTCPMVKISCQGEERTVRCRMVVGADGSNSPVGAFAGIQRHRTMVSNMAAYELDASYLPHPGYGHVFLSSGSVSLACPISGQSARILFDVPGRWQPGLDPEKQIGDLAALPETLQSGVRAAIRTQKPLFGASCFITPSTVVSRRLVLTGDAAGCCHPLTATGMSACTRDALRLRQVLRESNKRIPQALQLYAALRRGPERTRVALARALYQTFTSHTQPMELLRNGLLRYWRDSSSGRAGSLALLCTSEGRMSALLREYARVLWYSVYGERVLSPRTMQLASGALLGLLGAAHKAYVQR